MVDFSIASSEEIKYIDNKLDEFNKKKLPLSQEEEYIVFKHVAKVDDQVVGGIFGYSSYYRIGYIETLWVDERYRNKGIGSDLLNLIETDLKNFGCKTIHLETFDFQGPDFYIKMGYEEFGKLFYSNVNLYEIFLKKDFA
ncbi:GNAT family N-acetyltransferase [Amphibacillus sp. Q70]|uniref:GNAT family N-acetyltransferase n=1 Tax=Amphibacillus sp. Q70 TaxID=3453416 RepID=UPI003F85273F